VHQQKRKSIPDFFQDENHTTVLATPLSWEQRSEISAAAYHIHPQSPISQHTVSSPPPSNAATHRRTSGFQVGGKKPASRSILDVKNKTQQAILLRAKQFVTEHIFQKSPFPTGPEQTIVGAPTIPGVAAS